MRLRLPTPPPQADAVARLTDALEREAVFLVSTREAVSSIMLLSPNGAVYRLTVDDAGALKTELVQGGAPKP
jgi:hypothetical protein